MSTRTSGTPRELLDPKVLASLSNLELVARAAVHGFLNGLHRSPFFGFSQEFAEYRAYAEGDDPRFVDWNVYARTERTYVKRYLGETNTHLVILLDASASMGYGSGEITKLQYAKFLAATLAYLASRQHDAVGLVVFDDEVREQRPPSSQPGRLSGVLHAIDRATPGAGTDLGVPFERFRQYRSGRGLVAVISDFFDPAGIDGLLTALKRTRHRLLLVQLVRSSDRDPALQGDLRLRDCESGATEDVSVTSGVLDRYRAAYDRFRYTTHQQSRQTGPAVRAHHDHVDILVFGESCDCRCWVAGD